MSPKPGENNAISERGPFSLYSIKRRLLFWIALPCVATLVPVNFVFGQSASVAFEDSYAVYGPNIFPAVTGMRYCEPYRVLIAYINGTDMLFVDRLELANNQSTLRVTRGVSIREFNFYEQSAEILSISCLIDRDELLRVSGRAHSFHANRDFEFSISFGKDTEDYTYESNEGG